MTTLKDLQKLTDATRAPIEKEITYKDGGEDVTASVLVKRISVKDYEALYLNGNEDNRLARTIHAGVMVKDDRGRPVPIPLELAELLPPAMAGAMINAFNEVNVTKKS
jgi:hypothetical protein